MLGCGRSWLVVFALFQAGLTLENSCSEHCRACGGPERDQCLQCQPGFTLHDNECVECSEEVLACSDINALCVNTEGSFQCQCAPGFTRRDSVCVRIQQPGEERSLLDELQEEEVEVLKQMFFGVVLCALATLAAKGDMVFTSIFMGAVAAVAGYWLSDKTDRMLGSFMKGR
ncbi:cysteine-rich with EGF-like domain protein 1 [Astyanax mexicanus]|uniref:Cysteine-rich with EGF-like domain protein 1 n=2 Tax=Astyanax mexicanus TaxID=7994 RepID=A0A8T2KMS5_ASTMX|nr:cysteine-rich with EGF-like domain protein 1 [Astyanax mexicanus]KAG9260683.1 cysteine-rich with EGF-like domain protein 1 [Astyanax mexicanus]